MKANFYGSSATLKSFRELPKPVQEVLEGNITKFSFTGRNHRQPIGFIAPHRAVRSVDTSAQAMFIGRGKLITKRDRNNIQRQAVEMQKRKDQVAEMSQNISERLNKRAFAGFRIASDPKNRDKICLIRRSYVFQEQTDKQDNKSMEIVGKSKTHFNISGLGDIELPNVKTAKEYASIHAKAAGYTHMKIGIAKMKF